MVGEAFALIQGLGIKPLVEQKIEGGTQTHGWPSGLKKVGRLLPQVSSK
jgi:hypothetical protein